MKKKALLLLHVVIIIIIIIIIICLWLTMSSFKNLSVYFGIVDIKLFLLLYVTHFSFYIDNACILLEVEKSESSRNGSRDCKINVHY